ncbi:MAG: hypothetical protein K6G12_00950 [Lachnospiraceae bacterium]|nr:hypothetical protein [Lachnospiraceae bacterium]
MKAVVLEVRNGKSAVLAKDGTVRQVNKEYEVGQTINIRTSSKSYARYMGLVAAALVLLTSGLFTYNFETAQACSYVTLDVNPSIEYAMNRLNEVISIEALNTDAVSIVNSVNQITPDRSSLETAMENTLTVLGDNEYLTDDEEVFLVDVVTDDAKRTGVITEELGSVVEKNSSDKFCVVSSSLSEREIAHENNISAGRYKVMVNQVSSQEGAEGSIDADTISSYKYKPVREMLGIPYVSAQTGTGENDGQGSESIPEEGTQTPEGGSQPPAEGTQAPAEGIAPAEGDAPKDDAGMPGNGEEAPSKPEESGNMTPENNGTGADQAPPFDNNAPAQSGGDSSAPAPPADAGGGDQGNTGNTQPEANPGDMSNGGGQGGPSDNGNPGMPGQDGGQPGGGGEGGPQSGGGAPPS